MVTDDKIANRRALEALRNGVPNRDAVRVLGCDQPGIEELFRRQLQATAAPVQENGGNIGMIVAGEFGAGKSHLLEYLMHIAGKLNFVCSKVVISKETPLYDPAKLYRAAIDAAIVPGRRGNAMTEIAAALKFTGEAYADFYRWVHREAGINSRFPASLFLFERMANDPELSNRIIRFWSGYKISSVEIRRYLRACREPVTYQIENIPAKELALQAFQFAPRLMKAAGYAGWVLLIDEAELIGRYTLNQRAKSYAELARWTGKIDSPRFAGLTSVVAITQDFAGKILVEKNDLEQVPNKLRARGSEADLLLADQAEKGMRALLDDTVRLKTPDKELLKTTYEKVRSIHALAYEWDPPPIEFGERLLSTRMRQYVKGWITEWDLKRLDAGYKPSIEVEELAPDYTEDKNLEVDAEHNDDKPVDI